MRAYRKVAYFDATYMSHGSYASYGFTLANIPHLLTTSLYRRGLPAPNGYLLGVLEKLAERERIRSAR